MKQARHFGWRKDKKGRESYLTGCAAIAAQMQRMEDEVERRYEEQVESRVAARFLAERLLKGCETN